MGVGDPFFSHKSGIYKFDGTTSSPIDPRDIFVGPPTKESDFTVYNIPRPLPGDPIPGWRVEVRQRHNHEFDNKEFVFSARKGKAIVQTSITVSISMWEASSNRSILLEEVMGNALYTLKEDVLQYTIKNDETLQALKRTLADGLTRMV